MGIDFSYEVGELRALVKRLTDAILEIDAKATPYGAPIVEDGQEFVAMYLMPAGPLHRALGLIGRNGKDGRDAKAE